MHPPFDDSTFQVSLSHNYFDPATDPTQHDPAHQDLTQFQFDLNPDHDHNLNLNHPIADPHTIPFATDLTDLSVHSLDHQHFDHAAVSPFSDPSIHGHDSHTLGLTHDSHFNSHLISPSESIAAPTLSHHLETHSSACSSPIHPGDDRSVEIYDSGKIYWHCSGGGQVGTVSGHKYYDSSGNLLGILKSNLEVVNANGHVLGHVTPGGCAYAGTGSDSTLFASEGSARWAAATLIFNLSRA
jgi:hypothetical protein